MWPKKLKRGCLSLLSTWANIGRFHWSPFPSVYYCVVMSTTTEEERDCKTSICMLHFTPKLRVITHKNRSLLFLIHLGLIAFLMTFGKRNCYCLCKPHFLALWQPTSVSFLLHKIKAALPKCIWRENTNVSVFGRQMTELFFVVVVWPIWLRLRIETPSIIVFVKFCPQWTVGKSLAKSQICPRFQVKIWY